MKTKPPIDFGEVISGLALWREEILSDLRSQETHASALALKRQIDTAIACLEMCERFDIHPTASVTVLPDLQTMSPSCAYRVVEDGETDDKQHWTEFKVAGNCLTLTPGDIIIEQP